MSIETPGPTKPEGPLGLLAELTYRCPLACAYCSNPIEIAAYRDELSTADWQRVITEAADLGALQCHLSGGERELLVLAPVRFLQMPGQSQPRRTRRVPR